MQKMCKLITVCAPSVCQMFIITLTLTSAENVAANHEQTAAVKNKTKSKSQLTWMVLYLLPYGNYNFSIMWMQHNQAPYENIRTVPYDVNFNKNNTLSQAPITSHACSPLHISSADVFDNSECPEEPCRWERNHREANLLALCFLSLIWLRRLPHLLRPCSLCAIVLLQLFTPPAIVVFLGHPDHRLPSGVALLQLLERLCHLRKWKLGFNDRQDLWRKHHEY